MHCISPTTNPVAGSGVVRCALDAVELRLNHQRNDFQQRHSATSRLIVATGVGMAIHPPTTDVGTESRFV